MTAHNWTYLIADLATNVPIGELPMSTASIMKMLNGAGTLIGTSVPITDARVRSLNAYDMTTPARRVIYAIRDSEPFWGGIIWTRLYDSEAQTVQLGCGDFWTYFDHRKLIPILSSVPPVGPTDIAQLSITYSGYDQNDIARALVTLAQSHTGGNIGVTFDTTVSGLARDRTYWGYELGDIGPRLKELVNVQGGPDAVFDVNGYNAQGRVVRTLRLGTPTLGVQGSPHVWETGGNIIKYRWPSDGTKMATRTFGHGSGQDINTPIAAWEDTVKYTNGWPLLESEVSYTTVVDYTTLQNNTVADQIVSRLPVVLPTLTVRGDKAPMIGEYSVGDDALVNINDAWRQNLSARMRIVQIDITPSDDAETPTLTMAPITEEAV